MNSEGDAYNRGVLSLVQYCHRVAANHVESISSLGDMSYELVKPILERCSADALLRLEQGSPHLQEETQEIWRDLCYRVYPGMMERSRDTTTSTPKSWRKHYFVLREAEAKRLEEIGSRIRSQRLEAEGRKKEREVKMTDRLPPPKRAKTWGTATQPKTLFQKTRSEASKMQKNMYHARIIPPMPKAKDYGPPKASVSLSTTPLLPPPVEGYANRVTVNIVKRPVMTSTTTPKKSAAVDKPRPTITVTSSPHTRPEDRVDHSQPTHHIPVPSTPTHSGSLPMKSPSTFKKDPMATLFVPKHRAYSQRTR